MKLPPSERNEKCLKFAWDTTRSIYTQSWGWRWREDTEVTPEVKLYDCGQQFLDAINNPGVQQQLENDIQIVIGTIQQLEPLRTTEVIDAVFYRCIQNAREDVFERPVDVIRLVDTLTAEGKIHRNSGFCMVMYLDPKGVSMEEINPNPPPLSSKYPDIRSIAPVRLYTLPEEKSWEKIHCSMVRCGVEYMRENTIFSPHARKRTKMGVSKLFTDLSYLIKVQDENGLDWLVFDQEGEPFKDDSRY